MPHNPPSLPPFLTLIAQGVDTSHGTADEIAQIEEPLRCLQRLQICRLIDLRCGEQRAQLLETVADVVDIRQTHELHFRLLVVLWKGFHSLNERGD